jgi:ketosteroid isomerase-like protein
MWIGFFRDLFDLLSRRFFFALCLLLGEVWEDYNCRFENTEKQLPGNRKMKKTILLATLATLALHLPAFANTPATVTLPADLDRVLKDYEKAWIAKDTAALAKLFTSDGMALPSGQVPAQGEESIRKAYSPNVGAVLNLRPIAYSASGDLAYVVGGWGSATDKPEYGKFVLVLRKVNGRWLIAADMDNSNQPRRAPAAVTTAQ